MESSLYQWQLETKFGPLFVIASSRALVGVYWEQQPAPRAPSLTGPHLRVLAQAVSEIGEYLGGQRKKFDVAIEFEGTEFQKKVWGQLQQIPYGTTISYKQLAEKLGSAAFRAVGSANGANRVSIVIPCHRVVATGGGLGGYSGGLDKKRGLLNLELK